MQGYLCRTEVMVLLFRDINLLLSHSDHSTGKYDRSNHVKLKVIFLIDVTT